MAEDSIVLSNQEIRRCLFTWLLLLPAVAPGKAYAQAAASPGFTRSPIDRGSGHRFRPFFGAGSGGYNMGVEGEYAVQPNVSVLGSLQGWSRPGDLLCATVASTGREGCRSSDGWGMGTGLRLSAVGPLRWWIFVQGDLGFYSYASGVSRGRLSGGGRAGIVVRIRQVEVELAAKYQRIAGATTSSGEIDSSEAWGALIVAFGAPIG
jgi:hypothetical protein